MIAAPVSTLNPLAPMFIPGAKGHKTLAATLAAAAAMNPSGDKKIPAPATIAGGRRISAIRPPSARPVPRAGARAVNVHPISRPPNYHQGSRPMAIEVRPIGRQGSWGMPCHPTAQGSAGAPFFIPQGTIDMLRPATARGSAVPQQGYPTPPEFQPVRPVIRPGRVEPFAHLFNGETPHDKVWPRTFGPGQPHNASIIHKLQDQEFLPQSGWWCWLEFEGRYDLMPYY